MPAPAARRKTETSADETIVQDPDCVQDPGCPWGECECPSSRHDADNGFCLGCGTDCVPFGCGLADPEKDSAASREEALLAEMRDSVEQAKLDREEAYADDRAARLRAAKRRLRDQGS